MYDVPIHGHVTDVLDELYSDYVHRVADPSIDVQRHFLPHDHVTSCAIT
jgi:hypothetical protein